MMSTKGILCVTVLAFFQLIVCVAPSCAVEDWPGFRGPNFDGTISSQGFKPETGELIVSWRAKGGAGYSGISIADGKAVTAFTDRKSDLVVAFDSRTGKELWRHKISPLYTGHDGSHDGPIATPLLYQEKVFALSAYGNFVAIDANSGKQLWTVDINKNGGRSPFYGYTSSPVGSNGVVVLQIGGEKGKAVAGFDVQTGALKWSVGDDMVNYQSPILMKISGKERVLAVSDKKLFVIEPETGKKLFEYDHGGDDAATILVPVPLDEDRLLLRTKEDSSEMVRLISKADGTIAIEKIWAAGVFKNSYDPPVYFKGHFYGFNGRILTCVDASNGQTKWRTRAVGDGFTLLVNGYLVVQTKTGILHVGFAKPEGWIETNQVKLFDNISWTSPSYADNAIFSRSHGEIARIELSSKAAPVTGKKMTVDFPADSRFAAFLNDLEKATDKKEQVDQFFASQKEIPLIESSNRITFLYRGEAEDVAITGDLLGQQQEEPMKRLPGTDLFYYTTTLEPDARINYRYVRNYEETIADPHNPRATTDRRGNPMSWIGMPQWKEPDHLKEPAPEKKGKFESHELKSEKIEGASMKFDVYLPAGYDASKNSYPVIYALDGQFARKQGLIQNTLDNLIGSSVKPVIVVLVTELKMPEGTRATVLEQTDQRTKFIAVELIPFVDGRYRTQKDAKHRALYGTLDTGADAFYIGTHYPQLVSSIATQSMWVLDVEKVLKEKMAGKKNPLRIYMDWGSYDARSYVGGWDLGKANKAFFAYLKENGYSPAGGETHEGYGWGSWRNRTDRWLVYLFPMEK
ncbi:PQQ-binding-like beta-propeller repeat protein [bacterium]|nr:PQQ-binding-like beta-propeller repeat protein [bacterium]